MQEWTEEYNISVLGARVNETAFWNHLLLLLVTSPWHELPAPAVQP